MTDAPPKVLPGCDTCSLTIDSNGKQEHEPNCLREKHNKLKAAVLAAIESLGNAIGEAKWGQ